MAETTVQVVPSVWCEPFGLVAVEAMARGTTVVVSAAGALPEIVDDGRTGYVVPTGDASALARRLADLLQGGAGHTRVRHEARRVASETFDIDRVVDLFVGYYSALLTRSAAAR
jgi:glycosyltransferase involved in cell wall biosynthesis